MYQIKKNQQFPSINILQQVPTQGSRHQIHQPYTPSYHNSFENKYQNSVLSILSQISKQQNLTNQLIKQMMQQNKQLMMNNQHLLLNQFPKIPSLLLKQNISASNREVINKSIKNTSRVIIDNNQTPQLQSKHQISGSQSQSLVNNGSLRIKKAMLNDRSQKIKQASNKYIEYQKFIELSPRSNNVSKDSTQLQILQQLKLLNMKFADIGKDNHQQTIKQFQKLHLEISQLKDIKKCPQKQSGNQQKSQKLSMLTSLLKKSKQQQIKSQRNMKEKTFKFNIKKKESFNIAQYIQQAFESNRIIEQEKQTKKEQKLQQNQLNEIKLIQNILQNKRRQISNHSQYKDAKLYSRLISLQKHIDRRQIKIAISFYEMIKQKAHQNFNQKDFQILLIEWLGVVYRTVASVCWNLLQSQQLNFEQIKILFTQNIIFNFIDLVQDIEKMKLNRFEHFVIKTINEKSITILTFLCTQYPQTKIQAPNISLQSCIPKINQYGRLDFQLISKSKVKFRVNQQKRYASEIMAFINFLIDICNKEYDKFENFMSTLFKKLFIPIKQRNDFFEQKEVQIDLSYGQNVKKYTKYKINRKIPKNVQKYTTQEITTGIFFIKHPSILRILSKWVEQLLQTVVNPDKMIRQWFHSFKTHDGMQYNPPYAIRKGLYEVILANKQSLQKVLQTIRQQCFVIEGKLARKCNLSIQQYSFLNQEQLNVGIYVANVQNALSSYLCKQLCEIIHFLAQVPLKVDKNIFGDDKYFKARAQKQLNSINLVNCRVYDLLRCKCNSGQAQIIWLIKQLQRLALNQHQNGYNLQMVRYKDRLHFGSRDILINAQLDNGPAFQIQLSVTNQSEKKQEFLDQYNHFLYQLRRSTLFGPLIQNVSIWGSLEQRAIYFGGLVKSKKIQIKAFSHQICPNKQFVKYSSPIVCESCNTFFHIPKTCLFNWRCKSCHTTVCGQCYFKGMNDQELKFRLSPNSFSKYFLNAINIIQPDLKNYWLPKYLFCVNKGFLQTQISFLINYEGIHQGEKLVKSSQIVIRGNKIISRGVINSTKDYHKLKNFLLFQLPQKQLYEIRTLKDLIELDNQSSHKIAIFNLLYEPTYLDNIQRIVTIREKKKMFSHLQKIIGMQGRILTVNSSKGVITLASVYYTDQQIKSNVNRFINLKLLNQFAQSNSSVVYLQRKNVTDEFRQIEDKIGKQLYTNMCKNVTKLYLNYGKIRSIEDIRNFVNLKSLYLSDNEIISLNGIETMINLQVLNVDNNQIDTLQLMGNTLKLKKLNANNNKLTSMKGLQNLTQLKQLSLSSNNLTKIQYMPNLKKLSSLIIGQNKLTTLNGVESLENLSKLIISCNPIKSFTSLTKLKNLKCLWANQIQIEQIPYQINNLNLTELSLVNNKIRKISNLHKQVNLEILNLSQNKISCIEGLDHNTNLVQLFLQNNEIRKIQGLVNVFEGLEILSIKNNPIDDCGDLKRTQYYNTSILCTLETFTENAKKEIEQITKQTCFIIKNQIDAGL